MLIRSQVEGVGWPALVGNRAAKLSSLMFQLEQSQWWPEERIRFVQLQQLSMLLQHALDQVPHYRDGLKIDPCPEALQAAWSELPLLTRPDIQNLGDRLYAKQVPEVHGKVRQVITSGSTGQPVRLLTTDINQFLCQAFTLRGHLWHERAFHQPFASIRPDREPVPGGLNHPDWGPPAALLYDTGPGHMLHSSVALEEQIEWLKKHSPGYLLSMPSNLRALAHHLQETGQKLPFLVGLETYGEALTAQVRAFLQSEFDVPVVDVYSTVEIGYIALQCPGTGDETEQDTVRYHVQSESVFVEVLNDKGGACQPGEIGRVVVTPLHAFASPMIRYELGDYAEVGTQCPCGRGLPVLTRILGRSRNLVTLPDGSRHWPSFPEEAWAHIAPIRQLQLAQTDSEKIEVRLVMDRELTETEREQLRQVFADCLRYPFRFEFTYHDTLLRGRNLKFEDFVSELRQ